MQREIQWSCILKFLNCKNNRAEKFDEKSGVIYLFIMFSSGVMFLFFVLDDSKKLVKDCAKYLSASEKSYLVLLENNIDC